MLSPSSCHPCVWMQASPLIFTNVAASTVHLALSSVVHTRHLSLWGKFNVKSTKNYRAHSPQNPGMPPCKTSRPLTHWMIEDAILHVLVLWRSLVGLNTTKDWTDWTTECFVPNQIYQLYETFDAFDFFYRRGLYYWRWIEARSKVVMYWINHDKKLFIWYLNVYQNLRIDLKSGISI